MKQEKEVKPDGSCYLQTQRMEISHFEALNLQVEWLILRTWADNNYEWID